ncbi:unnamed protein product [Callosobruchus maculatus]|uniref:Uncharacterized protein n=1 Tax=Callosobruchus maculatus TaxID=64391 RepID=A0A653CAV9_CALMS|nr:unnamed protein product [Callosobruchus maculatus]
MRILLRGGGGGGRGCIFVDYVYVPDLKHINS